MHPGAPEKKKCKIAESVLVLVLSAYYDRTVIKNATTKPKETQMTTKTIARGSQFSREEIYDSARWDGNCTAEQIRRIGDEIVKEFDRRANAALPYASLITGTAEVLGDADADYPADTAEILDRCLADAITSVCNKLDVLIDNSSSVGACVGTQ